MTGRTSEFSWARKLRPHLGGQVVVNRWRHRMGRFQPRRDVGQAIMTTRPVVVGGGGKCFTDCWLVSGRRVAVVVGC